MQNMQQIICWSNWKSIEIRHREHVKYIKMNNLLPAYALHILNNRHEYSNLEHTIQLLQACRKGKIMNCWESFYIQVLQQQNLLIKEQKANEPTPLYALANTTQQHTTQFVKDSVCTGQAQQQHKHTGESIIK